MGSKVARRKQRPHSLHEWLLIVAQTVWGSLSLKLAILGFILILTGYVIQTGVYAALFPIWGGALVLVGLTTYVLIWLSWR